MSCIKTYHKALNFPAVDFVGICYLAALSDFKTLFAVMEFSSLVESCVFYAFTWPSFTLLILSSVAFLELSCSRVVIEL